VSELSLSELTTMRVGGPAARVVSPETPELLVEAVRDVWASGDEVLIIGGGSNLVVADEGFDGVVVRVVTRGITRLPLTASASADPAAAGAGGTVVADTAVAATVVADTAVADTAVADGVVRLRVEAGEPWDELVQFTVDQGWAGIEALSGIPGSCGASPIQNIGAYGQEVATALVAIDFLDYLTGTRSRIPAAELELGYRTSALKEGRHGVVVAIELELSETADGLSNPIAFDQLAKALGVVAGDRVPLPLVRSTVLSLRASKGMVLDPADPDSVSAGSFFTNPLVGENFARTLPADAPRWLNVPDAGDVAVPLGDTPARPLERTDFRVKLSAAWLIEHAGIHRGFALPGSRAAISSKHTLAITNRGGASAAEIAELARYVQTRVFSEFGVRLQAEPVLVGLTL
jgi:UDP-N-acetylmuramate dehydrogenase